MRTRGLTRNQRLLALAALVAGPLIVIAALLSSRGSDDQTEPLPPAIHAGPVDKSTVYHSPQSPGYTAWVGAWLMPDDTMMTGFVQATGPLNPAERPRTPDAVLELFGTPRQADPQRDFWGLDLSTKFLRSSEGGGRWEPDRSERFRAIGPFGYTSQATMALKDGTIVRRVNGDDLRQIRSIPHTAFLQRLAPGAKRWSRPHVLMDPRKHTYQLTRIRYLRDGRLVATGNVWDVPADTPLRERAKEPSRFLLMVSDDQGRTWRNGLRIPASVGDLPGNEWDTGELPSGDLAAVMRTAENGRQVRKQALLRREGDVFVMGDVKRAPMPHSGHPELLATREGPVLDIATSGVSFTRDGLTWQPLRFPQGQRYVSSYYPRSLQTRDGVVHVFGHRGYDNPYGTPDQSITMDSFRVARGR
ncbi:MAG TPA: sialidase family protein [Thermoleophilaceae bacterium]|nr:sialidase family protein [Thermoleophilaceae bacterium]